MQIKVVVILKKRAKAKWVYNKRNNNMQTSRKTSGAKINNAGRDSRNCGKDGICIK